MPTADLLDALARTWFGAALPAPVRRRLVEHATLRRFEPGETILVERSETQTFGVVVEGRVALRMLVPERGSVTILTVEPGDVVGWSALVGPFRSTSTAVASEPTTLLVFDPRGLRATLAADDALAAIVYPRLLEAVARRLEATRNQLLDLYAQQRGEATW